MRSLLVVAAAAPLLAVVDGTVINQTTGKPQPGATVTLYKLGQAGMESIESIKSGAAGQFSINQTPQGPHLLQTAFDGVTYNHMLPPGQPTTGLSLNVYSASQQPGGAKVSQHFVLFESDGKELVITENFLWQNDGKTTYNDPDRGTLRVYVPEAGMKTLEINATAPQGMPIRRAAEKTSEANVYYIDFPIKPGESTIQLNYRMPFTPAFEGRVLFKRGGPTSLIAPAGVQIKGQGLEPKGQEPRTQAAIFQTLAAAYKIEIEGTGALRTPVAGGESEGGFSQVMPKVFERRYWVLGLSLAILALGFILLYRK